MITCYTDDYFLCLESNAYDDLSAYEDWIREVGFNYVIYFN